MLSRLLVYMFQNMLYTTTVKNFHKTKDSAEFCIIKIQRMHSITDALMTDFSALAAVVNKNIESVRIALYDL